MSNSFLFPIPVVLTAAALGAQAAPLGDPRPRLPGGLGDCVACALADFDRDGRPDLARASSERIVILKQSASGVFTVDPAQASAMLGFAAQIRALAAADFDGDGDFDLAVGLLASADVLLLNDGAGRFVRAPAGSIPSGNFLATAALVAGDFDRVGGADLLVLPVNGPPRLLLQSAAGGFVDASALLPVSANQPRTVAAVADFDHDGADDLVLGGTALAPTLVLINSGTGSFLQNVLPFATAANIVGVATADLDGDQIPELVLAPDSTASVPPIVARVSRLGVVRVPPMANSLALTGWSGLALGDLDRDGLADCIGMDASGAVWIGRGAGNATFRAGTLVLEGGGRRRICAIDLDADRDLDLIVPGGALPDAILLGAPGGNLVSIEEATAPSNGNFAGARVAIVDATGEGDPDLLLCSPAGRFTLWVNDGGARFVPGPGAPPDLTGLGSIVAVLPGRLSSGGDARDVFIVGQPGAASVTGIGIYGHSTLGTWVDRSAMLSGSQLGRIFSAAATSTLGSGRPVDSASDLLLGDIGGRVSVHRNDGVAIRELAGALPAVHLGAINAILSGDLDGDGACDVVVLPASGSPVVHMARGTSRLQFVELPGAVSTLAPASAGVLDDLDGDGRLDLFCATPGGTEGVALLHGVGNGTFVDVTPLELGALLPIPNARTIAALGPPTARRVIIGRQAGEPLLLARRPQGTFGSAGAIDVHGSPSIHGLSTADLDGDGDIDVVATRDEAGPAVLLRSDRGLASRGAAQVGRVVRIDVSVPPTQLGFVLFSPFTARVPIANWGILRLISPATFTTIVSPPGGSTAIEVTVPLGLAGSSLPMQLVTFDPLRGELMLGNLEIVASSDA